MNLFLSPIKLIPNRVYRGYPGGREIDRFRNARHPADDDRPEAWVGSVTPVKDNMLDERGNVLGLAGAVFNGETVLVKDLLEKYPEEILGREHFAQYGAHPQILVKLLDAQKQLGLQCHPTREFAKTAFGSAYGKTESWYVISLRQDGPKPYLILGFQEGANRRDFARAYDRDDIAALEAMCHKIPVQPGEMYFVDAGVPHAIGPGCFVVEVQEPSDITVGATRKWDRSDDPIRQEFLDNRLLDSYIYDGCSIDELYRRLRVAPLPIKKEPGGMEEVLLGKQQTPWFSVSRVNVARENAFSPEATSKIGIAIVTKGVGRIITPTGEIETKQGDEWLLPASMANYKLFASGADLEMVVAHPPKVY